MSLLSAGGVIEYKGIKIDFSQVPKTGVSGFTVPVNIGVSGQSISDSSTTEILDTLREAMASDLVIIDLEEGQAWWETRLLVLLAGAVRLKKPEKMVFVGTDGGVGKCFQGWGYASELLPYLLQVHPQYLRSYHTAMAAARQWELVEPVNPTNPDIPGQTPPQPTWIQTGLASRHQWMAFENNTGLPNELLAEQLLASDLGERVEAEEQPKRISLIRLEELFRPILHKVCVEETLSIEDQMKAFFHSDAPYVAITQNRTYLTLVSRLSVLNVIVNTLVQKK